MAQIQKHNRQRLRHLMSRDINTDADIARHRSTQAQIYTNIYTYIHTYRRILSLLCYYSQTRLVGHTSHFLAPFFGCLEVSLKRLWTYKVIQQHTHTHHTPRHNTDVSSQSRIALQATHTCARTHTPQTHTHTHTHTHTTLPLPTLSQSPSSFST